MSTINKESEVLRKYYFDNETYQMEELVGFESIKPLLTSIFKSERIPAPIILVGPHGSGRSKLAQLLWLRIHCDNPEGLNRCGLCYYCEELLDDVMFMQNISQGFEFESDSGPDVGTGWKKYEGKSFKSLLIDDLDTAKKDVLIRIPLMLDIRSGWDIMVFTATDLEKLPLPIIQRCTIIPLGPYDLSSLIQLVKKVCKDCGIKISNQDTIKRLIQMGNFMPGTILNALEVIGNVSPTLNIKVLESPIVKANLKPPVEASETSKAN